MDIIKSHKNPLNAELAKRRQRNRMIKKFVFAPAQKNQKRRSMLKKSIMDSEIKMNWQIA
jgi:hypothetical protein